MGLKDWFTDLQEQLEQDRARIANKYDKIVLASTGKMLMKYRKNVPFKKFVLAYRQSLEEDIAEYERGLVKDEGNKTTKRISFSTKAEVLRKRR